MTLLPILDNKSVNWNFLQDIRSLERDFQTGCQAIFIPTLPVGMGSEEK